MTLVYQRGPVAIYAVSEPWGFDYWVYGITSSGDPRVCPSLGMALEIAH